MRKVFLLLLLLLALPLASQAQVVRATTLINNQTLTGNVVFESGTLDNSSVKASAHVLLVTKRNATAAAGGFQVCLVGKTGSGGFACVGNSVSMVVGTPDDSVIVYVDRSFETDYRARVTVTGGGGGDTVQFTVTYFGLLSTATVLPDYPRATDGRLSVAPLVTASLGSSNLPNANLRGVFASDGCTGCITGMVPYIADQLGGGGYDVVESAFLVQQQGTGAQDSNDGSGIWLGALFGFDRNLQTYNLLSSTSATSLGISPQIRVNTSMLTTSYQVQATQTTAVDVLNVAAPANPDLYFEGVNVSCLAACVVNIHIATAAGTTCTAVAPANLNPGGGASTATSNTNCTVDPTLVANSAIRVDLPATSSRWVDLTGIVATLVGDGVSCISSTATTVSCTIRWYEK
jgi:hypothetical protein